MDHWWLLSYVLFIYLNSSSVTTVLELPLLDLTISNLPDPVTADINYEVLCQVIGSQPPPKVVWKLADVILPSEEPRLSLENNLTTSQLYFTPKIKDQGKVLSCEADNGVFPSANKSVALNVYYIPVVHIEIINDIDPSNIREGDEVVLRCNIQAHPWVWRILWYKDGEELVPSNRVSIDEQRLKLSNVTKVSNTSVINDPLGQSHSHKNIMITGRFVWFALFLKSWLTLDVYKIWSLLTVTKGRPKWIKNLLSDDLNYYAK